MLNVYFCDSYEMDHCGNEVRAYLMSGLIELDNETLHFDYCPLTGEIYVDEGLGSLTDEEYSEFLAQVEKFKIKQWYKHKSGLVFHAEECIHPNYGYKYYRCFDPVNGYQNQGLDFMLESEPLEPQESNR